MSLTVACGSGGSSTAGDASSASSAPAQSGATQSAAEQPQETGAGSAQSGSSSAASAEPTAKACDEYFKVSYGAVGSVTDAGIILADRRGYFHDNCIEYKFEKLTSGPSLTTALASDAIQAAGISQSPGLFTGVSKGIQMRIVGDKSSCTKDVCANGVVVRKEFLGKTEAETWNNVKGKKFAVSALGSNVQYQIELLLDDYKLTTDDYEFVVMPFPDMIGAIQRNQIQAANTFEPYASKILATGCCEFMSFSAIDEETLADPPTLVPLVYGPAFLDEKNREAAQGFMDAYVLGVRDYIDAIVDGKNRDEIYELIATDPVVNVTPEEFAEMHKIWLDPNQLAAGDSLQNSITWLSGLQDYFVDNGSMSENDRVDPASMFDVSFAKKSVERFGEYE